MHEAVAYKFLCWLSWFIDMELKVSVTRGHMFKSQPLFIFKWNILHQVRRISIASTLLAQRRGDMLMYIINPKTSTISLIF